MAGSKRQVISENDDIFTELVPEVVGDVEPSAGRETELGDDERKHEIPEDVMHAADDSEASGEDVSVDDARGNSVTVCGTDVTGNNSVTSCCAVHNVTPVKLALAFAEKEPSSSV